MRNDHELLPSTIGSNTVVDLTWDTIGYEGWWAAKGFT